MSELEQVAEAMRKAEAEWLGSHTWLSGGGGKTKAPMSVLARSAIEALRMPTPNMIDTIGTLAWDAGVDLTDNDVRRVFTAMIDAILSETKPDTSEAALQELADQAQKLDMGY